MYIWLLLPLHWKERKKKGKKIKEFATSPLHTKNKNTGKHYADSQNCGIKCPATKQLRNVLEKLVPVLCWVQKKPNTRKWKTTTKHTHHCHGTRDNKPELEDKPDIRLRKVSLGGNSQVCYQKPALWSTEMQFCGFLYSGITPDSPHVNWIKSTYRKISCLII